jgi:hypothetical protein
MQSCCKVLLDLARFLVSFEVNLHQMSVNPTNQIFNVTGELVVNSAEASVAGYKDQRALISFRGSNNLKLGQIRAYGGFGSNALLMDGSSCTEIDFRTLSSQGSPSFFPEAVNDQFTMILSQNKAKIKTLDVKYELTGTQINHPGTSIFNVNRSNSLGSSSLINQLVSVTQDNMRVGETIEFQMGPNVFSGCSVWSYTTPTSTSASAVDNYSSISMIRNNARKENIRFFVDGNVDIPNTLSVKNFSVSNQLNALSGNITTLNADTLQAQSISSQDGTFINLNADAVDTLVITSGTGNFTSVDSQQLTSEIGTFTSLNSDLSTIGDLTVVNDLFGKGATFTDPVDCPSLITSVIRLPGSATINSGLNTPQGSLVAEIGSLYLQTNGTTGQTLYIKESGSGTNTGWVAVASGGGGGPTDLTPITLDKTNNRVGIKNTNPLYTLDVNGDCNLSTGFKFRINGRGITDGLGTDSVAIGRSANAAGNESVAIGFTAGSATQGNTCVAIGKGAGSSNQGLGSVAVGASAGNTSQQTNAVAIGVSAGSQTQGIQAVAIGLYAGLTNQSGYAVAIGGNAGKTTQGLNGIAIGNAAGSSSQGASAVAIGNSAGLTSQASHAIAIGLDAGRTGQLESAIAIGNKAGNTNQHANSIILNASGLALNSLQASSFYVKPVRSVVDSSLPRLHYNASTGEIAYGDSTVSSFLPITLDKTNNRVGINNVSPVAPLDVSGVTRTTNLELMGISNSTSSSILYYNDATKNVTYGALPSSSILPISLDTTNNRVGVNNTSPQYTLDVDGMLRVTNNIIPLSLGGTFNGYVGQVSEAWPLTDIALTTALQPLINLSLPPGTYILHAYVEILPACQKVYFGIQSSNSTLTSNAKSGYPVINTGAGAAFDQGGYSGHISTIVSSTTTKTYYLNGKAAAFGSAPTAWSASGTGLRAIKIW